MTDTKSLFKKPAFLVLAVLTLVGIVCWIMQQINGLGATGMNNSNSWGLYITCFMFFVGLSAGGLIVASSAHVFGIESFKKVSMPAVIVSTACICVAGMMVLVDLGGIQRIWRIIIGANFTSPLLWDMCIITLYLIINILDLVWMNKGEEEKVRKLSYVALPVAILVHSVTAWIFGLEIAKEGWYSAIMAPIFVASAMDSGLALLLCALTGLKKAGKADVDDALFNNLGKLLATFIAVDAFFIGCELLTMGYPGAEGAEILAIMTTGSTAAFFWFEIIAGLLVPFVLLASPARRNNKTVVLAASALVILGVFCKRVWLLFTSFVTPNVYGGAGITLGTSAAQQPYANIWSLGGTYAPTVPEVLVALGVISLGVLIFLVLSEKLLAKKEA
ncbi:MAG: polysulfide reductase NrfD [Eggerthellales bacterium]|nr:polysulfide reductase NrfD [Eggerthellales bacterium]